MLLDRSELPQNLIDALATGHLFSHSTLLVTLTDGAQFAWASAELAIDGVTYAPYLKESGELKVSLNSAADRIEVTLVNLSSQLGATLVSAANRLEKAQAIYARYLRDSAGNEWHVGLLDGAVVNASATANEVKVPILSAVDAAGDFGTRPIVRHCMFRKNGPRCLATTPGPCSKIYDDDVAGCLFHDNQQHFGGFFYLPNGLQQNNSTTFYPDGRTSPGIGWDRSAYEVQRYRVVI